MYMNPEMLPRKKTRLQSLHCLAFIVANVMYPFIVCFILIFIVLYSKVDIYMNLMAWIKSQSTKQHRFK